MTKTAGNGKFHVLMTSDGSPYQRWQSRAMYYHYEKQRAKAGAAGAMGDFTRLLHSGVPDDLMSEIPTGVVNKLPTDVDDGGYVVLHRPYAIKQWLDSHAAAIEEEFVLLAEPDHLFLRPMPLLASNETAVGYPFFYITPNDDAPLSLSPIVARAKRTATRRVDAAPASHASSTDAVRTCDANAATANARVSHTGPRDLRAIARRSTATIGIVSLSAPPVSENRFATPLSISAPSAAGGG